MRILIPLLILTGTSLAGPEMIPESTETLVGQTAPSVELPLAEGGTFRLEDHRGHWVALAFWASWCSPCRAELPALVPWGEARPNLNVVAVNVDRDQADAYRFLERLGRVPPIAWDPEAHLLGVFGALAMPTTVLVDPHGTVRYIKRGYGDEHGFTELEEAMGGAR